MTCSKRQRDVWTDNGLIRPLGEAHPGTGRLREWPSSELAIANQMGELVALGLKPATAARVARAGKTSELVAFLAACP